MTDKIEEIRITLALNPKQIAERMLSGEVTSESHFVSQEDHLHVASLVDAAHREIVKQRADNERLRAALKPFAALSLWPDDIGDEWTVNDIRSGYDWDETENDTKTDDVFIKRGHIRAARKALESKP